MDGCDYCGTQFKIPDFGTKIAGYHFLHDYKSDAFQISMTAVAFIILSLLVLLCCGISSVLNTIQGGFASEASLFYKGFLIAVKALFPVTILAIATAVFFRRFRRRRTTQGSLEQKITRNNYGNAMPTLNLEAIATGLEYRLKQIHFAQTREEIQAFAEPDITDYFPLYEDVVDCTLSRCNFYDYRVENGYQYISADAMATLDIIKDRKIKFAREILKLTLKKKVSAGTDDSIQFYSCPDCGDSISLLNGGICESCGRRLTISDYDWVIAEWNTDTANVKSQLAQKHIESKKIIPGVMTAVFALALIFQAPAIASLAHLSGNYAKGLYQKPLVLKMELVPSPYDAGMGIEPIGFKLSAVNMEATSKISFTNLQDPVTAAKEYAEFLIEKDSFLPAKNVQENGVIVLDRSMRMAKGTVTVTLIPQETSMEIHVQQIPA